MLLRTSRTPAASAAACAALLLAMAASVSAWCNLCCISCELDSAFFCSSSAAVTPSSASIKRWRSTWRSCWPSASSWRNASDNRCTSCSVARSLSAVRTAVSCQCFKRNPFFSKAVRSLSPVSAPRESTNSLKPLSPSEYGRSTSWREARNSVTATAANSASVALARSVSTLQPMQTRCGSFQTPLSVILLGEHLSHTHLPHILQWCRRRDMRSNAPLHRLQFGASSGSH
mmetsp:Transcript_50056/g.107263  ORF Transcript_50056/g.107263 Transcript_50056/m.107263 type:complete len:230 (-) Transcript_50056:77-766(-)